MLMNICITQETSLELLKKVMVISGYFLATRSWSEKKNSLTCWIWWLLFFCFCFFEMWPFFDDLWKRQLAYKSIYIVHMLYWSSWNRNLIFFFYQMQIFCVLTHTFPINYSPYFNHYKLIELIPMQSKRNYLGCNQQQCCHKNSLEKIRTEPQRLNQRSI